MISALLAHNRGTTAWIVVAFYLVGAAASFWASRTGKKRDRRFWIGTSILLVLLGLGKQFDLQSVLTDAGRYVAHYEGWYDHRRIVQGLFVLALVVGGFFAIRALLRWLKRSSLPMKAAALGVGLLMIFIVVRAASLHQIDRWVMIKIAGLRSGWWLELAAITVIGLAALTYRGGARGKQSR